PWLEFRRVLFRSWTMRRGGRRPDAPMSVWLSMCLSSAAGRGLPVTLRQAPRRSILHVRGYDERRQCSADGGAGGRAYGGAAAHPRPGAWRQAPAGGPFPAPEGAARGGIPGAVGRTISGAAAADAARSPAHRGCLRCLRALPEATRPLGPAQGDP